MEVLLRDLALSISDARSLEDVARSLLGLLEAITGLESTFLTRFDEREGQLEVLYARNREGERVNIAEGLTVPWDDALCQRALVQDRPYTQDAEAHWGDTPVVGDLGVRTYLSLPVRDASGALFGTLCAASSRPVPVADDTLRVVGLFAQIIAHQIEREQVLEGLRRANEELVSRVMADPLTGIANRRALELELKRGLARAGRENRPLCAAFVDLDGFKAINDRHGHDIGDRFLIHIAGRLAAATRSGDFIARFGGDEFVVLTREAGDAAGAEAFAARLAEATRGRFASSETGFDYPGASVGTALSQPGDDGPALLKRADAAMYTAKKARRL